MICGSVFFFNENVFDFAWEFHCVIGVIYVIFSNNFSYFLFNFRQNLLQIVFHDLSDRLYNQTNF